MLILIFLANLSAALFNAYIVAYEMASNINLFCVFVNLFVCGLILIEIKNRYLASRPPKILLDKFNE